MPASHNPVLRLPRKQIPLGLQVQILLLAFLFFPFCQESNKSCDHTNSQTNEHSADQLVNNKTNTHAN